MNASKFDQVTTLGGQTVTLTSEDRFVGEICVRRYRIITTNLWVYEALEPCTTHHTTQTIDRPEGKLTCRDAGGLRRYDSFGAIGTQALPAHIAAMSTRREHLDARLDACKAWRDSEARRAHEAILLAFPEAAHGEKCGAQIEVTAK